MPLRKLYWLLPLLLAACNLPVAAPTASAPYQTSTPEPTPTPRPAGFMEPTLAVAVELTADSIDIEGVPYLAYQTDGDSFRFVCPAPCTGYSQVMYWQYAGFRAAHELLIQTVGVDTLSELQPVDIHLMEDPKCGARADAPEPAFAGRDPRRNAYVCSFVFEDLGLTPNTPITPEAARAASRLDHQADLIHAYLHTIFYGRVPSEAGDMHDFVTPISLYVTKTLPGQDLCTYRPATPPGDYGGRLIINLCEDAGFEIEALAPTMRAVDRLYRSDDGRVDERFEKLVPDMAQFRWELRGVLGRDVATEFADACWPADLFEDTYELDSKCWP
jgi:hypothetical protein